MVAAEWVECTSSAVATTVASGPCVMTTVRGRLLFSFGKAAICAEGQYAS